MSFQVSWDLNHIPQLHVLYSTCKHRMIDPFWNSFVAIFIHSSCVLVTLGIKNSLQPKQLSKCLPRRHPQKHYNLNKTYVPTWLSPVLTRLFSFLLHRAVAAYWMDGWMDCWLFIPNQLSWYNVIYCRIIHKIAGDDKELKTKYCKPSGCTEEFPFVYFASR